MYICAYSQVTVPILTEAIRHRPDRSVTALANALQAAIAVSLRKGGVVGFNGFGCFYVARRAARSGRNPRTGEAILIAVARVVRFKASKSGNAGAKFSPGIALKAAVN